MISRRSLFARVGGLVALVGLVLAGRQAWVRDASPSPAPVAAAAAAPVALPATGGAADTTQPVLTIYMSPTCRCCAKWVDHIRASGLRTVVHERDEMEEVKAWLGVPEKVRSCHTAQVGGYLIEGHVPAEDVRRLLDERPKVAGLAVPGMPSGTPGMETPGQGPEPYEVVSFQADGAAEVFARH